MTSPRSSRIDAAPSSVWTNDPRLCSAALGNRRAAYACRVLPKGQHVTPFGSAVATPKAIRGVTTYRVQGVGPALDALRGERAVTHSRRPSLVPVALPKSLQRCIVGHPHGGALDDDVESFQGDRECAGGLLIGAAHEQKGGEISRVRWRSSLPSSLARVTIRACLNGDIVGAAMGPHSGMALA